MRGNASGMDILLVKDAEMKNSSLLEEIFQEGWEISQLVVMGATR